MNLVKNAMATGPVIPVLVIDNPDDAVPLARALIAGGVRVLEITLRTPRALDVIKVLAKEVPQAILAAGTITTPEQWDAAAKAGAQFAVSPGLTPRLLDAARDGGPIALLPGVATASELMVAMDAGFTCFKFFPAQQAGGVALLKALGGPFPDALFCPTGGITTQTAPSFLSLPNVACVGGSWLAPAELIQGSDWPAITALAQAATRLRGA